MNLHLPGARLERTSEGQTFFFEERYGYAYVLNGTGAVLVEALLAGDPDADDLVRSVLEAFDGADERTARADVRAFVDRLRGYGLLP